MATALQAYVDAVRDELGGRIATADLSDAQLAGMVRQGLNYLRQRKPQHFDWTISNLTSNRATVATTFTPTTAVDSQIGTLIVMATCYKLAVGGYLARGEQNIGSWTGQAGSARTGDRVVQHRQNAAAYKQDLDEALATFTRRRRHGSQRLDFNTEYDDPN